MAKLRKRVSLRIPDRMALAVALVLTVTAAGSVMRDALHDDLIRPNHTAPSTVMPVATEKVELDPTSDDATGAKPLTARFLLFRHG